jgi:hypothetical protein
MDGTPLTSRELRRERDHIGLDHALYLFGWPFSLLFASQDLSAMAASGPTASASTFRSCAERRRNTTPRAPRTDCIKEFFELPSIWKLVIFRAGKHSPTSVHIR